MYELIAKNNDFSEFDNDPKMSLIRVDRNNTHHYIDHTCHKCGGTGYIPGYEHVEGGVCFLCGGNGRGSHKVIVRTAEYAKKLADARLEKARKTAASRNAEFLKSEGFSTEGETWVVMGDTYKIKDQLKFAGARYSKMFGWHFDREVSEFPTVKVTINDMVTFEDDQREEYVNSLAWYANDGTLYFGDQWHVELYVRSLRDKWEAEHAPTTEHYGEINDKVELTVKLIKTGSFDGTYGTNFIYTFESADGYVFVWKTTNWLEEEIGSTLKIKGTIKAHSEYRGIKQTQLTRCKIA